MDVKVTAERVGGEIAWTVNGKKPKDSVIEIPPNSGRHTLDFHLDDKTDMELSFAADPIWVHETEDGACPTGGINTRQITIASVKPKKLSVTDENAGGPCTLQYQLNFVDRAGERCVLDPAIRNGGGTDL